MISIASALREFSDCAVEREYLGGDWWSFWVEKSELRGLQGSESRAQERRLPHRKETSKIYRGPLEHSSEFCSVYVNEETTCREGKNYPKWIEGAMPSVPAGPGIVSVHTSWAGKTHNTCMGHEVESSKSCPQ